METFPIRFITDPGLFPLCRALRMLGFDALNRSNLKSSDVIEIAIEERRVWIRTNPEELNLQYGIRYFLVSSWEVPGQLEELDRQFSLKFLADPFSRCLKDNALLRLVPREVVLNRAPENILKSHDRFYECLVCGRVYWQGSHLKRMAKRLAEWGWIIKMTNGK
jgi:uncharacterized protein with PIN domain